MKVTGACHCQAITYEAEVDPARVTLCHCTDCQVLSGSAYRASVPTEPGSFRLLGGTPKVYLKTTADSGRPRRHGFCADCGTPVYAAADEDDPPVRSLRVGALAQREQLPPQKRIWTHSALQWSLDIDALPAKPRE